MQNIFVRKEIVLGIIVLFVGVSVIPSKGLSIAERYDSQDNYTFIMDLNSRNNILYVGGNGEDNYTSIQDAINDASDGNTVFVFSYSSPYYENVVVNKTINLIGEKKDTTVIDGGYSGDVIKVTLNWVIINGFTIQNSGEYDRGIYISSNECNIFDNIILNNGLGMDIRFSSNTTITSNNIISNKKYGIYIYKSNRNSIMDNIINSNNRTGIILRGSNFNTISGNTITSNKDIGIYITAGTNVPNLVKIPSQFNIIKGNHITSNNGSGIYLLNSGFNIIIKNNFLDNELDAYIKSALFNRNLWWQNYWDKPRLLPKIISRIIIISGFGIPSSFVIYIPWFNIDRHPAREPYNI